MRVAVLGAGLQGGCVAMELADAGVDVDVYDRADRCVSQASAHNDGKIHLGYVHAHDPTLSTARLMARGAVAFAPLMRRWLGERLRAIPVSSPFYYAVRAESLLAPEQVERHLRATQALAVEESRGLDGDYFGADYPAGPVRLSDRECGAIFDRRTVAAAFRTPEVAIDPEALAAQVRSRIAADLRIRCVLGAEVLGATQSDDAVAISFRLDGSAQSERVSAGPRRHPPTGASIGSMRRGIGRSAVDRRAGARAGTAQARRLRRPCRLMRSNANGSAGCAKPSGIVPPPLTAGSGCSY